VSRALPFALLALGACEDAPPASSGTGASGGAAGSYEAFAARCESLTSPGECNAEDANGALGDARCVWVDWVEVTDAATCTFGGVDGRCEVTNGVDTCGSIAEAPEYCSDGRTGVGYLLENGTAHIAKANWCESKQPVEGCTQLEDGSWPFPECACLCAPDYPSPAE
jgi:hypothetical protein